MTPPATSTEVARLRIHNARLVDAIRTIRDFGAPSIPGVLARTADLLDTNMPPASYHNNNEDDAA